VRTPKTRFRAVLGDGTPNVCFERTWPTSGWRTQHPSQRLKCNALELRFCATVGEEPEVEVALA